MRKTLSALGAALLLAGPGCSTTHLSGAGPGEGAAPVRHVLVVARLTDEGLRQAAEEDLERRLRREGLEVERSTAFVPSAGELDPARVAALAQQTGADAVLETELVGVQRARRYRPAGGGWYPDTAAVWPGYAGPGQFVEERVVRVSTRLFRAGPRLVWSATSDTFDPASARQAIASANKAVVKRLGRDGLL